MEKRILITGGAGFIGSHLCEKLLKLKRNIKYNKNCKIEGEYYT